MRRSTALVSLAVLAIVASGVGGLAGTATAEQDVAVSTVNVTPSEPAPDERVQFTTTISNLESSEETIHISDVYVEGESGQLARVEDLGSVAVGDSMTVPLSFSFNSVGEKDLRVHVVARDSEGYQRIQYPVQVTVKEPSDVNLAMTADDFVAGQESKVNVTVANGGDTPISNIELTLSGDGQVANPRRVSGSIPSDTDSEYAYSVTFESDGTGTLNAALRYTVEGGATRTASESIDVSVDPADAGTEGRIELTGVETTSVGNRITIEGDAANVGTTDAQSVLLTVQETDGVTPVQPSEEFFIGTVEGSEFGTFELTADVERSVSSVPILVEWTVDGERERKVTELDVSSGAPPAGGSQSPVGQVEGDGPGDDQPAGGSPGLLGGIGGPVVLLLAVVVLGAAYYVWKR